MARLRRCRHRRMMAVASVARVGGAVPAIAMSAHSKGLGAAHARILLVDDDLDILRILRCAFEAAGHVVESAVDPLLFEALVAAREFDAVVLDVMMPGRSGWEILAELRRNANTAKLPVLMLSAAGDAGTRVKGIRLGADDFLSKPFDAEEVVVRVEGLVARRAATQRKGLQGSLAALAASDVAQNIVQNRQSGRLELEGTESSGWLGFGAGRLVDAHLGRLPAEEAALELLCWHRGRFHFEPATASAAPAAGPPLVRGVEELLIEAAWLADELVRRREHVPSERERLLAGPLVCADPPEDLPRLPLAEVHSAVATAGGLSLGELLAREVAAPARIRLAVAVLAAIGALRRETSAALPPATCEAAQPVAALRCARMLRFDGSEAEVEIVDEEVAFPAGRLIVSRADPDGRITQVNDSFCEISGFSREEVIGQPHAILRHPDMPSEVFRDLWATLSRGEIWNGYVKNRRKDGRFYWVYATIIPNQRGGRIVGYTSVRREPSRTRVDAAEAAYQALACGRR